MSKPTNHNKRSTSASKPISKKVKRTRDSITREEGVNNLARLNIKEFAASTAKKLKAACGAGRVGEVQTLLQKHGCMESDCFSRCPVSNRELLVDCACNAARMIGKNNKVSNDVIINQLLDLGVESDFHMLYHATLNCTCCTLRRCLVSSTSTDHFGTCAAHALSQGLARKFLLLVEEFQAVVPAAWFISINAFIELTVEGKMMSMEPDDSLEEEDTTSKVLSALFASWNKQENSMEIYRDAETEIQRLSKLNGEFEASGKNVSVKPKEYFTNAIKVLHIGQDTT